jgi:hypothetical protein
MHHPYSPGLSKGGPMRAKRFILEATVAGMVVHPLGALIAWAGWPGAPAPFEYGGWAGYAFVSLFALVPLLAFAGVASALDGAFSRCPALRTALLSGRVLLPLSALYAQIQCCRWAHTDAQGAVAFLFAQFVYAAYAVAATVVLGLARTALSLHPRWR